MKKFIITVLLVLCVAVMPTALAAKTNDVTTTGAKEPVKVYLFFASWCPHCHDFINYFSDKYLEYADKFEIVPYQVDGYQNNGVLMTTIESVVGRPSEDSGKIPLIVIGDWYQGGFGKDGTNIIEKALAASTDKNYKDVVAETISKNKLSVDPMEFSEAVKLIATDSDDTVEPTTTNQVEETSSNDTLIVIIVFAVIVLGFGGLFLYSRKSSK